MEQGGGNWPELQLHESLIERLRKVNSILNTGLQHPGTVSKD